MCVLYYCYYGFNVTHTNACNSQKSVGPIGVTHTKWEISRFNVSCRSDLNKANYHVSRLVMDEERCISVLRGSAGSNVHDHLTMMLLLYSVIRIFIGDSWA